MVTLDRIRLRGLLRKSPAFAGLFYSQPIDVHHPCITTSSIEPSSHRRASIQSMAFGRKAWLSLIPTRPFPGVASPERQLLTEEPLGHPLQIAKHSRHDLLFGTVNARRRVENCLKLFRNPAGWMTARFELRFAAHHIDALGGDSGAGGMLGSEIS